MNAATGGARVEIPVSNLLVTTPTNPAAPGIVQQHQLHVARLTILHDLAAALNERGIPSASGAGQWKRASNSQVLTSISGAARWHGPSPNPCRIR
jgi:hypothetical protein